MIPVHSTYHSPIEVIMRGGHVRCVVLPEPLTTSQIQLVHAMFEDFRCYPKLVTRWGVWGVLAEESWVSAMNERGALKTRPSGTRLHFADLECPHVKD